MISVCMATYNGMNYLREQIDSILMQLSTDDELVISDDGSSDNTIQIITSYNDSRIVLLNNQSTHGFVGNFENALIHAKGNIIFLADQDDIWKPGKVAVVTEKLKQYDLVIHDADMIDGKGCPLDKTYYSTLHHRKDLLSNLWKTRWLGCCMAFRRNLLDMSIPFPRKIVGHDYWIGMLGMLKFRYCFMDDVLICYRRHGNNVSPSGGKSNNNIFYKLFTKRLNIIVALISRCIRINMKHTHAILACIMSCLCAISCAETPIMAKPLFPCSNKLDSPYGICAHFTQTFWDYPYEEQMLRLTREMGADNVRYDFWIPYAEPLKENGLWEIMSQSNKKITDSGMKSLAILFGGWKGQRAWNMETQYKQILDSLVRLYANNVPYWEVFNEVDMTSKTDGISLDSTVKHYMSLLPLTYQELKKANKNLKVTSSGIADIDGKFLEILCKNNAYKYFDILNFHSYDKPERFPDKFTKIRSLMDTYGWHKPVWITECGMSTYDEKSYANLLSPTNKDEKEAEQARRIPRLYLIAFAFGVDKVFTYSLRSRENNEFEREDHFGIVHADLSPKPAFNAYKMLTRMLPSGSSRPTLVRDGDVYLSSWKRQDGKKVYAIWTSKGKNTVDLRMKGKYDCYDINGKLVNVSKHKIEVSPSILYFVGSSKFKLNIAE